MGEVLTATQAKNLFRYAKANGFALPAMNVVGTNSVNAAIEAARKVDSPLIIQFSSGGSQFFAGQGLPNENHAAEIAGAEAKRRKPLGTGLRTLKRVVGPEEQM